jgi:hypothetical protein
MPRTDNLPARSAPPQSEPLASDKQIGYALALLDERGMLGSSFNNKGDKWFATEDNVRMLTRKRCSDFIAKLLTLPQRTERANTWMPDVPDGHYAVQAPGDSMLGFYEVRTSSRGFRKLYRQLSDDRFYISPQDPHNEGVWLTIAANPKEAALRYGRELGVCGVCSRTLTNEVSRSLGIGPVCRARRSW